MEQHHCLGREDLTLEWDGLEEQRCLNLMGACLSATVKSFS